MQSSVYDNRFCQKYGFPPRRAMGHTPDMAIRNSLEMVDEIVIHHTDGDGTYQGLVHWMLSGGDGREKQYNNAVAVTNFYIDKGGLIYKLVPITRWTYHSCSGKRDKSTIGIELIHKSGDFTEAQYQSIIDLICELRIDCPNIKKISSHDYRYMKYSGKRKGCPGNDFDWEKLKGMLYENKFEFEVCDV